MIFSRRKFNPLIALELQPVVSGPHADNATDPEAENRSGRTRASGAAVRHGRSRWAEALGAVRRQFRARSERRKPALSLELDDKVVNFNGLAEFEFALSSRTEFPVRKVAHLVERPAEELEHVATQIRQVEKRFAEVLTQSLQRPGTIGALLREIEVKLFSQDHDWREIVQALNRRGPEFDDYRKIALVKYMQYLGSRQDVLRSIYMEKVSGTAPADAPPEINKVSAPRVASADDTQVVSMRDTAIFDLGALAPEDESAFVALPRGESVRIRANPGEPLEIKLSGCRCKLLAGRHCYLIDDVGNRHVLQVGPNLVGRHATCDVVLEDQHRSVSRKHLVVEPIGESDILLTDISSHGTFVPAGHL